MKNDVRQKLIDAANRQQINDLTDNILRNVDTNKVLRPTPSVKRRFNFVPLIFAGVATCAIVAVVGVSIGIGLSNNKSNNGSAENNYVVDYTNTSSETTRRLLNKISTQESYNIINIANSLNDVTFDNQTIGTGMDAEIEQALVGDFSPYIYNIESMFDSDKYPIVSTVEENKNSLYSFKNDLKVVSPYYEYHLYYDEVITEVKDEASYKEKSDITGVVVCKDGEFSFTTLKTIKNDTVSYNSKIYVSSTKYVDVVSTFKYDRCYYTYTFFDGIDSKDIYIEQKIKEEKTTEIEFKSRNKTFELTIKNNDDVLNCKVKSRDDSFTVTHENENHVITFKKSGNTYTI